MYRALIGTCWSGQHFNGSGLNVRLRMPLPHLQADWSHASHVPWHGVHFCSAGRGCVGHTSPHAQPFGLWHCLSLEMHESPQAQPVAQRLQQFSEGREGVPSHLLAWWHPPSRHSQQSEPFFAALQIALVVQPDTAVHVCASHVLPPPPPPPSMTILRPMIV